jgi:hypothetical protein
MDPTWFQRPTDIAAKLTARAKAKGLVDDPRYGPAYEAVQQYIKLGGRFVWGDLTPQLIAKTLGDGLPILTGANGTYLYQCVRETEKGPDDVAGVTRAIASATSWPSARATSNAALTDHSS